VREDRGGGAVDEDLLNAATARIDTVPDIGEIEIVLAGDLGASIRRRLSEEHARVYSTQRVSGAVGAKTIPREDGCAIVVDSRLLVPGVAAEAGIDVERMFEHEAWHAALTRAGKASGSCSTRWVSAGPKRITLAKRLF
jgi:hypothetical protein